MPIAFIATIFFYCNFAYFAIYRGLKSKYCIGKDLNKLIYTVIYSDIHIFQKYILFTHCFRLSGRPDPPWLDPLWPVPPGHVFKEQEAVRGFSINLQYEIQNSTNMYSTVHSFQYRKFMYSAVPYIM